MLSRKWKEIACAFKICEESGRMDPWLRELIALKEDLSFVPSIRMEAHKNLQL